MSMDEPIIFDYTRGETRRGRIVVTDQGDLDHHRADLARLQRLWNRLEAAVSHHKKAHDSGRYFADDPDVALWKARDKILKDYAEGKS